MVDNGIPQRNQTARVSVTAVQVNSDSKHAPVITNPNQQVQVTESDSIGYLVALIQAVDEDGDKIWYNIVGEWRYTMTALTKYKTPF